MPDILIRIILSLGLLCLIISWKISTKYSLFEWLSHLPSKPGIITVTLFILLFSQAFKVFHLPLLLPYSTIFSLIGLVFFILGVFLAIWAKISMKSSWGLPADHDVNNQKELVITGPYSFSRHPMYLGIILALFGFETALSSSLVVLTLPFYLLVNKVAAIEEKLLEKHFGGKYLEYRKKVPRFF